MADKIKIVFSKTGEARFISHLDLMRLFQRAARRAALDVVVTKGFNPHLKISIARALKLGVESHSEEAIFHMDERTDSRKFTESINEKLPNGIKVLKAEELF